MALYRKVEARDTISQVGTVCSDPSESPASKDGGGTKESSNDGTSLSVEELVKILQCVRDRQGGSILVSGWKKKIGPNVFLGVGKELRRSPSFLKGFWERIVLPVLLKIQDPGKKSTKYFLLLLPP